MKSATQGSNSTQEPHAQQTIQDAQKSMIMWVINSSIVSLTVVKTRCSQAGATNVREIPL